MKTIKNMRSVRSFIRRSGRISISQSKALIEFWDKFGIEIKNNELIDYDKIFTKKQDIVIEIGFGNGDSLLEMAIKQPQNNFIGIEVYEAGIGRLINQIKKNELHNIKIIKQDGVEVLQNNIKNNSISSLQLFFPDPWHKKKHNKRRILNKSFLDIVVDKLKTNGIIHIATDYQDYAKQIIKTMQNHSHFKNAIDDHIYNLRVKNRPITKFENRGRKLGHNIWDIIFIKNKDN